MKTSFMLAALCLSQAGVYAQKQGTVTYLEKVKMEIQLDSATRAMLGDLPDEASVTRVLHFNENTSLYMSLPEKENNSQVEETDGHRIEIKTDAPDEKIYCDFKNNRVIEQREFMGKQFLIDTALTRSDWKLTGKQKTFLGYPCQQAVKTGPNDTITVWFTPAIQVGTGPEGLWGLPGIILEMEKDNGLFRNGSTGEYRRTPDQAVFIKPREGKKVKPKEFKNIVERKTKEMQEQYGGKGNVIIQVERR